jgi:hypothetical protein
MAAGCDAMQPAVATPQQYDRGLKLTYITRKGTAVVLVQHHTHTHTIHVYLVVEVQFHAQCWLQLRTFCHVHNWPLKWVWRKSNAHTIHVYLVVEVQFHAQCWLHLRTFCHVHNWPLKWVWRKSNAAPGGT